MHAVSSFFIFFFCFVFGLFCWYDSPQLIPTHLSSPFARPTPVVTPLVPTLLFSILYLFLNCILLSSWMHPQLLPTALRLVAGIIMRPCSFGDVVRRKPGLFVRRLMDVFFFMMVSLTVQHNPCCFFFSVCWRVMLQAFFGRLRPCQRNSCFGRRPNACGFLASF